jgi:hypothetical protein
VPADNTLTVASGGTLNVPAGDGKIDVQAGATVIVQGNGTLTTSATSGGLNLLNAAGSVLVVGTGATVKLGDDNALVVGSYVGNTISLVNTADLTAALGAGNTEIDGNGSIVLKTSKTLTGASVTVPYGVTLVVPKGNPVVTLTVDADKTLTVAGNIEVAGKVEVTGTGDSNKGTLDVTAGGKLTVVDGAKVDVKANGQLDLHGMLDLKKDGTIDVSGEYIAHGGEGGIGRDAGTNNGIITIKTGGITHGKGGAIGGTGTNVVEKGGKALYTNVSDSTVAMINGTSTDTNADSTTGPVYAATVFKLTDGTLSFNNWDYVLNGNGTLCVPFQLYTSRKQKLTVRTGKVLTIADTATAAALIEDSTQKFGGIGTVEPPVPTEIVVEAEGGIVFATAGNSNFYNSSNAKIEANASTKLPAGTYKWVQTLGTSNAGGWQVK